jgi:hypothetical protein
MKLSECQLTLSASPASGTIGSGLSRSDEHVVVDVVARWVPCAGRRGLLSDRRRGEDQRKNERAPPDHRL